MWEMLKVFDCIYEKSKIREHIFFFLHKMNNTYKYCIYYTYGKYIFQILH